MQGAEHWSELRARDSAQGSSQRERLHRVALMNRITRHYGVAVRDWEGSSWIVSHATGATLVIDRLGDLWPAVEQLAKRRCDPLDAEIVAALGS
jgi:hypothetical protein